MILIKRITVIAVLSLFVLSFAAFTSLGVVPLSSAATGSAVVQTNASQKSCIGPTTCTISLAFSSPVTAGNVIVVGMSSSEPTSSPVETIGTSGSGFANSMTYSDPASGQNQTLYWTTIPSSGTDTVSFEFNVPSGMEGQVDLYIFEVSGVTTSSLGKATGSGNLGGFPGTVQTSSSVSFQPGAFLVSLTGDYSAESFAATSGWTLLSQGVASAAIYSTSGVSSPTDFPVTDNYGSHWVEVGLALNPIPSSSGVPQFPIAALSTILLIALLLPALLIMGRKFRAAAPLR